MPYRTFISLSSAALVIGSGAASPARRLDQSPAPGDPRPVAAVRMEINARFYAEQLRGDLAALRKTLGDSVLAILEGEFGFVNWRPANEAPRDTVVLTWAQPDKQPIRLDLEIRVRGAAARESTPFQWPFEHFSTLSHRRDWTPGSVGAEWLARLRAIVDTNRSTLVAQVFGALPLRTSVELDFQTLSAHVLVDPDSMRVPARSRPRFRVRGMLHDPGPPEASEDSCNLVLGKCRRQADSRIYLCDIELLAYLDAKLDPGENVPLLTRAHFSQLIVHLLEYRRNLSTSDLVIGPGSRP